MRDERVRKLGIDEYDIVVQRRVAKQHVEKLAGIGADGGGGQSDAHLEQVLVERAGRLDLSDDLVEHEAVVDGRDRHLDALLDRDGARARVDRARIAADMVDGGETGMHGR